MWSSAVIAVVVYGCLPPLGIGVIWSLSYGLAVAWILQLQQPSWQHLQTLTWLLIIVLTPWSPRDHDLSNDEWRLRLASSAARFQYDRPIDLLDDRIDRRRIVSVPHCCRLRRSR